MELMSDSDQQPRAVPLVVEDLDSLRKLVGCEFTAVNWFSIAQERIQTFAEVTNDLQWIHIDPARAQRESPYRTTVAHGFLTLSLLSQFMSDAVQLQGGALFVVNYGLEKVRFPSPVRAGEQIRAKFLLRSLTDIPGGLHAVYVATVEIKDAIKPCCVAEWIVRYYTSM